MLEAVSIFILYLPFVLFIVGLGFCIWNILQYSRQNKLSELKPSKEKFLDFAVLILRWYLAYYMLDYGWGKMTGQQFGSYDPSMLDKPLKEISKFELAWYLFSLSKIFDIIVGITQIIGAILIVFNRTTLVGALFLLPILGQILLVDLAFTTEAFGLSLSMRLIGMIVSDLIILYYYKDKIILVWNNLTKGITTKFKYHWWVFLLLPLLALLTDFGIAILTYPLRFLLDFVI